jgi:hypothetical protein
MNVRACCGLLLSVLVLIMVPLSATTEQAPRFDPWPDLLAEPSTPPAPQFAALQQRANEALERLLQAGAPVAIGATDEFFAVP